MKILYLNLPAHGHVNPTLPVTAELVRRGAEVHYRCTADLRDKIAATGAHFEPYGLAYSFSPDDITDNPFPLMPLLAEAGRRIIPGLVEWVEGERPDLIVHDAMAMWGKHLSQITGVPAVATVPTVVLQPAARRMPLDYQWWSTKALLRALPDVLRYVRVALALRREWGVDGPRLFDAFANREPLNIVFTSRAFQPGAETLGDDFQFVGPSIGARPEAPDFPLAALERRTAIYISLGTLFHDRPGFYRTCFAALGDLDATVVLSVGERTDVAALGTPPDNVIVRPYVPQLEVLARADLFVTHGGMNSTSEGLYHEVPLVVVPQGVDQYIVAHRVDELGAGRNLGVADPDAATLRAAVETVLGNPGYSTSAARIGRTLREAGGYERAADLILGYEPTTTVPKAVNHSR